MNVKKCRQCGELKPLSQYRQYYGGRKGCYTICKQCEKVNSRLKYLEAKEELTELERIERDKILQLYEVQRAAGLRPPQRGKRQTDDALDLDAMISKYAPITKSELSMVAAPAELRKWLTCELTEEPDVYIDDVYEELIKTYRPVLSIDKETMAPVYDESNKDVLDAILKRFYDYEDTYYKEED